MLFEKFGLEEPAFFDQIAQAWIANRDANKIALYHHYIINEMAAAKLRQSSFAPHAAPCFAPHSNDTKKRKSAKA
ncbi:MAG: hypothetical protein IJ461_03490 [Clostridia bacterium]|nr:hypothetical protein [Clostridia bacterium]